MKIKYFLILSFFLLLACTPVLREELIKQGSLDFQLSEINKNSSANKGKLFILGGKIIKTTLTKEGSLIEALYVPVNSRGYLKELSPSDGRYMAIYSGDTILDPSIYSANREITLAGEYIGTRTGKIDEIDYNYPLFEIKEIYLWAEGREYDDHIYHHHYWPWFYRHRYYDPYDPWYYH